MTRALRQHHPRHREVPLFIVASLGLLLAGLALPLMRVEKMVLWSNEYSVFTGVVSLAKQNELLLAAILFFFSMVFPFAKLAGLAVVWFWPMRQPDRQRMVRWLEILGRWSMLDVFVVAILIVLVKLGPLASIEPRAGVYVFGLAIIASMLTTMHVQRLVRAAR